jgi:hypothetical protein
MSTTSSDEQFVGGGRGRGGRVTRCGNVHLKILKAAKMRERTNIYTKIICVYLIGVVLFILNPPLVRSDQYMTISPSKLLPFKLLLWLHPYGANVSERKESMKTIEGAYLE